MGMTLSFGPHQMKKLPRPLVGTKTFIRNKEREMRNDEWSQSFGAPLIEALRDNDRERRGASHSSGSAGFKNGNQQPPPEGGLPAAEFSAGGADEDFDGAEELASALDAAGATVTFDRGRNNTHPCTFCGKRQPGVPLRLLTIGRYLDGHELTRPVCPACEPAAQKRMAKP